MMPEHALRGFHYSGTPVACKAFGSGHINSTVKVTMDNGSCYILQNINHHVFPEPEKVMANIIAVTEHLRQKVCDGQCVLDFLESKDGSYCYRDETGAYWRMYRFVPGMALDAPRCDADIYQAALAFGKFQQDLSDFPPAQLHETLPDFHNTPDRYRRFQAAIEADRAGRAAGVQREIDWFFAQEQQAGTLCKMLRQGQLPLRVTHNDTKLNNVLLDSATGKALCILDLDTVMPGLSAYDFGDAIRFGAATAGEDAPENALDLHLFSVYARGFLEAAPDLTQAEIDALPLGAWTMTLENGLRFLTDYLDGDRYFKIACPDHNLVRARNQMALAADMQKKLPQMEQIIKDIL